MKEAEKGNIELAMTAFNKSVSIAPKRASGYNNRAQGYRLQGKVKGKKSNNNNNNNNNNNCSFYITTSKALGASLNHFTSYNYYQLLGYTNSIGS